MLWIVNFGFVMPNAQNVYFLIGSSSNGTNIFFVRNDLLGDLQTRKSEDAYIRSQFRESSDPDGNLTFLDFDDRFNLIKDFEVYDLTTGENIRIQGIN